MTKDLDDPADHFAWLDAQLSAAATNNEKVYSVFYIDKIIKHNKAMVFHTILRNFRELDPHSGVPIFLGCLFTIEPTYTYTKFP